MVQRYFFVNQQAIRADPAKMPGAAGFGVQHDLQPFFRVSIFQIDNRCARSLRVGETGTRASHRLNQTNQTLAAARYNHSIVSVMSNDFQLTALQRSPRLVAPAGIESAGKGQAAFEPELPAQRGSRREEMKAFPETAAANHGKLPAFSKSGPASPGTLGAIHKCTPMTPHGVRTAPGC